MKVIIDFMVFDFMLVTDCGRLPVLTEVIVNSDPGNDNIRVTICCFKCCVIIIVQCFFATIKLKVILLNIGSAVTILKFRLLNNRSGSEALYIFRCNGNIPILFMKRNDVNPNLVVKDIFSLKQAVVEIKNLLTSCRFCLIKVIKLFEA